jgi:hypothetical protein
MTGNSHRSHYRDSDVTEKKKTGEKKAYTLMRRRMTGTPVVGKEE